MSLFLRTLRTALFALYALSLGTVSSMSVPHNKMISFNHAGSSPSSDAVVDRVIQHLRLEQTLGAYTAAAEVADELEDIYSNIATLIGATDPSTIALVQSATVGWTRLFGAMMKAHQERLKHRNSTDSVILVSGVEYAANLAAIGRWCEQHRDDWTILAIPSARETDGTGTGTVCLKTLRSMLDGTYEYSTDGNATMIRMDPSTIALVAVTHIPTNAGVINPVEEMGALIAAYNNRAASSVNDHIFYLVDACQSVGHIPIHVKEYHCHGLVASGRKYLAGPRGTGFLYVSSHAALQPDHHVDHFGAPVMLPTGRGDSAPLQLQITPRSDARRFEFWESSIANRLGFGVAVRQAMHLHGNAKSVTIRKHALYLYDRFGSIEGVRRHYRPTCGIVTFWVPTMSSNVIHQQLLERGFETSVVPSTSTPIDRISSSNERLPPMVRASVSHTTPTRHIDELCDCLRDIIRGNRG